jgi:hypothetical protein
MEFVNVNKDLLKEASDIITNLLEENRHLKSENVSLQRDASTYKNALEREKIASVLEEKNLVPYEKIVSFKEGRLSSDDENTLRSLANLDTTLVTSSYEPVEKTASDLTDAYDVAASIRRDHRAQNLLEDLQSLKYQN